MAVVFVVFCWTIVSLVLPVTPNGDDFNVHFTAYSPGLIQDVWHIPAAAAHSLNEVPQSYNFDEFASVFPMPYDIQALLDRRNSFSLRIMNASWSGPADTNVFHRGDPLYLQVSASPGPGQQLYVQSCHASSSPNHTDKPGVALIINKGCVASKKSLVKFVTQQPDRVNLIVRTSSLKSSESYIHCGVYLTNLGVTPTTKFCNYNKLKSKWVDLGGQTSVCDCCGRKCRNLIERVELPGQLFSLDLTAVVSTGPLVLKDQESAPQATPLTLSDDSKSSPTARDGSDKNWIMASTSFSGSSKQNVGKVSPWPVQHGYGGVMVISKGPGSDLSMWLQDIMELAFNPLLQMGTGYPENPVDITFQIAEPLRPDESTERSPAVAVDEGRVYVGAVDSDDVVKDWLDMGHLNDVDHLHKIQEKPADYLELTPLHVESEFDFPPNDQPLISPTPDKLSESTEDEGGVVFRQAEMIFNGAKGAKLSEPVLYSKLSLTQAADGSSVLSYEEQKRPSKNKQDKRPQLEKNGEKSPKDVQLEDTSKIKGLVSSLLDQLRRLWTAQ
uniref:Zona pellucida protein C n=1 Tax=Cyprinus carpio carpio TaxID=630221 RepID=A0A8C1DQS3_CYPCA